MRSKKLHEIVFPVYMLRDYIKITKSKNLIRIITHHDEYVLDSLLMQETQPDYAIRRINLKSAGNNIYPLKVKFDSLAQITRAKGGTTFIDSEGYIFKYKRGNKFYKVVSREIIKTSYSFETGTFLDIKEIPCPLHYPKRLKSYYKYASVLIYKGGFLLYGVTKEQQKDKRVRV